MNDGASERRKSMMGHWTHGRIINATMAQRADGVMLMETWVQQWLQTTSDYLSIHLSKSLIYSGKEILCVFSPIIMQHMINSMKNALVYHFVLARVCPA